MKHHIQKSPLLLVFSIVFFGSVVTAQAETLSPLCPQLDRTLHVGVTGGDVSALQEFLASKELFSREDITGFFGPLTEASVGKFQCKQNGLCAGSPDTNGYGLLGPKTRATIAAQCVGLPIALQTVATVSVLQSQALTSGTHTQKQLADIVREGVDISSSKAKVVGARQVAKCDTTPVAQSITAQHATDSGKKVTIGFSSCAGGIINSVTTEGYADIVARTNLLVPDVGGSWATNFLDKLHNGNYNPAQAGYQTTGFGYGYGTPVKVLKPDATTVFVPRYPVSLWGDTRYDFFKNEVSTGTDEVIDRYLSDGGNSDQDGLADALETNLNDELRSGFEYTGHTKVLADLPVPAFRVVESYTFAEDAPALKQFNKLNSLDTKSRIKDIRLSAKKSQRATNNDLSYVTQTKATRLIEDLGFRYAHYRSDEKWVSVPLPTVEDVDSIVCALPLEKAGTFGYIGSTSRPVSPIKGKCQDMDYPLVILSTNLDVNTGFGVGIYLPADSAINKKQIVIKDQSTLKLKSENRRMFANMGISKKCFPPRPCQFSVGLHDQISGLFSPTSISAQMGSPSIESYRRETHYLFGTPEEILEVIDK